MVCISNYFPVMFVHHLIKKFFYMRDMVIDIHINDFSFQNYPGKFLISYLPRNKVKHEFVTVTPDGFRFRGQIFDSVGALFKWFKEHFRDPVPGTPGTPRVQTGRAYAGGKFIPNIISSFNRLIFHFRYRHEPRSNPKSRSKPAEPHDADFVGCCQPNAALSPHSWSLWSQYLH